MLRKILVANRGEIALRIIRACRDLGVETVAVYSEADADAPHVKLANEAVLIGPAPALGSYLNIPKLIEAARKTSAEAVYPGYGFLSENADFAEACTMAGLTFVGPSAGVMRRMGSKTGARDVAVKAGVPVVPGATPRVQTADALAGAVHEVGFPALIKAAAGGGGKGMRVVRNEHEVADAIGAAKREAERAFANGALYVERLVERPRLIEVQILGDLEGEVVHIFERDCSLQRRHQKVIEETPAPNLSPAVRERITAAAVAIAKSVRYVNAGTVEFLVEGNGDDAQFYFLEMNTRLQVEHPITEAVTGLDLVTLQLEIAARAPLPIRQSDIRQTGHAIECRVYAEDSRTLLPQAGQLLRYREPQGLLRIDSGVIEGSHIPVHYDPLLAKVITRGTTRDEALTRMRQAIRDFEILGVRHNLAFLSALLADPHVQAGATSTRFIEERLESLTAAPPQIISRAAAAVAATLTADHAEEVAPAPEPEPVSAPVFEFSRARVVEPTVEPVEPPPAAAVDPVIEPVLDPVIEPVIDPVIEPVIEHVVEPVFERVVEPVLESAFAQISEPERAPEGAPVVDTPAAPVVEAPVAPVVEPAATFDPWDSIPASAWTVR